MPVDLKALHAKIGALTLEAIYRRPNTSRPAPWHRIYPYLLRGLAITRPNQVWTMDITYIPMARGFVYLAAVVDWFSRRVLAWKLSIPMETDFCIETRKKHFPGMKNRKSSTPTKGASSPAPCFSINSQTPSALCELRLSITTTWPGSSFGQSTSSTYARKMSLSVGSSMVMVAIIPSRLMALRMVMIFQWPPGVASWMRRPPRQRACSRVMDVVTPLSSR